MAIKFLQKFELIILDKEYLDILYLQLRMVNPIYIVGHIKLVYKLYL